MTPAEHRALGVLLVMVGFLVIVELVDIIRKNGR